MSGSPEEVVLGPSWASDTPTVHIGDSDVQLSLERPVPSDGAFVFYLSDTLSTGLGFPATPTSTTQLFAAPITLSPEKGLHRLCLFASPRDLALTVLPPVSEQNCHFLVVMP